MKFEFSHFVGTVRFPVDHLDFVTNIDICLLVVKFAYLLGLRTEKKNRRPW
jgi:hypothetical protein